MALLAFWAEAQTLSTKLWQAWQAREREWERQEWGWQREVMKKREGGRGHKMETGRERKAEVWDRGRVYRERSCLCGVLMYWRCHRHWPASGQQSSLPETLNTRTHTHTHTQINSLPPCTLADTRVQTHTYTHSTWTSQGLDPLFFHYGAWQQNSSALPETLGAVGDGAGGRAHKSLIHKLTKTLGDHTHQTST